MTAAADKTGFVPGRAAGVSYLRRAGTGPVLLCLHGIGSRGSSFAALLPHLPADWDVVAWDAPGYGASSPLAQDWPVAGDYAVAALALMDALGLDRVTVLGHSLGTLMGAALARHAPARVTRLVLTSCAAGHQAPAGGPLSPAAASRLTALERDGAEGFAAARAPRLLADPVGPARATVIADMAAIRMPGYGQAVRMLASGNLAADLAQVRLPVTLIWGDGDIVTPQEQTGRAATALGGAPITIIENAGHALHAEAPRAVAAAIAAACVADPTQERIST